MTVTKTNICNQAMIAIGGLLITDVDTDTTKRAITMKELYDIKRNWLLRKYWWKFASKRIQLTAIEKKLNYYNLQEAFTVGATLTGFTSGATGIIERVEILTATTGVLWLSDVDGIFQDQEALSDDDAPAGTATETGILYAVDPIGEYDYAYAMPSDYIQFREIYPNYLKYKFEGDHLLSGESTTLDVKYTYKVTDEDKFDAMFVDTFAALLAKEAAHILTDSTKKRKELSEEFEFKVSDAKFSGSIEDDLEEVQAEDWLSQRM